MNKISILSALLLAAGSMGAQNLTCLESRTLVPQKDGVTEFKGEYTAPGRTSAKGAIPETIIGNKYVTYYGSFTSYGQCAGHFTVEQGTGDTVVLKEILGTYNLKGVYNKTAGTVTIPSGQIVGNHSTAGAITAYTLLAPGFTQYSPTVPCVLTFTDQGVTFDNGLYASVTAGGMAFMKEITSKEANGTMSFDQYTSTGTKSASYAYPVYFSKVEADQLVVQGFAAWAYAHDYNVQFDIVGTTATLPATCPVDYYNPSSGEQTYYLLQHASNGVSPNPTFTVTKDDSGENITLTANTNLFQGYLKDANAGSWSGFFLRNMKLTYGKDNPDQPEDPQEAIVDNINYNLDAKNLEASVTGCAASLTALDIPNTITVESKTYTVVAIGDKAFYNNKTITSVSIPKSLKTIGYDAFYLASNLRTARIEDLASWCSVNLVNAMANPIRNCLPTYGTWGKVYFNGTEVTTTLNIPEGVTKIERSFFGFNSLTTVNFPSTMKVIGVSAFQSCANLTTVNIPEGVDTIASAFYSCSKLNNVVIPGSVKFIGSSTFTSCTGLTDITLNEGLKGIGDNVFRLCSGLTKITIPASVETISRYAFDNVTNLKEVTCLGLVPPTTASDAFHFFCADATLYVPEAAIEAYKKATGWKEFGNIAISAVDTIENDNDMPAEYYTVNGLSISEENLQPGIYIERRGNKSRMIIVKQ